jgi:predicted nucleic acid-binding protein
VILADTGVWSRHFRVGDAHLAELLRAGHVACHAWIVGELALGPGMRLGVLADLKRLPLLRTVADEELLHFATLHRLRGIGWVDVQLLAATLIAGARLWSTDQALVALAERFEVGYRVDGQPPT